MLLLPDIARSPLVKTNANAPIFIGQIYRRVYAKPNTVAVIAQIDPVETRREDTITKYPHSLSNAARISYILVSINTKLRKSDSPHLTGETTRATFAEFRETFPYLCFCPRTFPFIVTNPSSTIQMGQINEMYDPTSERVKQIERSRWRHSQTK